MQWAPCRSMVLDARKETNHGRISMVPQSEAPRRRLATALPVVYSLVAPVFNEAETLPQFYGRAIAAMEDLEQPFELVLVNDGSTDDSTRMMRELQLRDSRVRVVEFSRNFGHQAAISAGLVQARGQAVIIIDSDLQDPPELVLEMAARWKAGAEVVYAQRATRAGETRFKLLTAALFYRLIGRLTDVDIPRDTGDFRLLDRKVVDALVALPEHHRFMRGLSAWVGFRQDAVRYERSSDSQVLPSIRYARCCVSRSTLSPASATFPCNLPPASASPWPAPACSQWSRPFLCG